MKLAFIFSPQGSQFTGMGKDLYDNIAEIRQTIDQADALLTYDLKANLFEDETALNNTHYVQTAMFTLGAAIRDYLNRRGIVSQGSAGLSLGELAAYYDRGVYDFQTGLLVVEHRGFFMDRATKFQPGAMAAVKTDIDKLEPLIEEIEGVYLANYNTENQLVVSGKSMALEQFIEKAKAAGIKRIIPLKTAGAFHSPCMQEAADNFSGYLNYVKLKEPEPTLYLNTTGKPYDKDLPQEMVKQITSPVLFHPLLKHMIADGFDTFVEIGPKPMITKFIKALDSNLEIHCVHDLESLNHTI